MKHIKEETPMRGKALYAFSDNSRIIGLITKSNAFFLDC